MKNYFDLSGQVAIVTGCSTGLGVQMAKALANQGAKIVAIAQNVINHIVQNVVYYVLNVIKIIVIIV